MFEEVDRIASDYMRSHDGSACQGCRALTADRARATATGDYGRADLLGRAVAIICATRGRTPARR